MTGTKFSKNVKRLKRENAQLVDALRPLEELNVAGGTNPSGTLAAQAEALADAVVEAIEERDTHG